MFYKTLTCGLREPARDDGLDRKIMAMSSDAIYNTTRGSVRPWKHTALGLGLGSLTGSKLVLRIMNQLGNSLSYDEVKALETEFAYSAERSDHDAHEGLELIIFQENPMATVKKVDCALLPPCAKTVHKKLLRAHFISIIWGNASSAKPADGLNPLDYGWKEDNGKFVPDWYTGPAMPDELFEGDIIELNENVDGDAVAEFHYGDASESDTTWSSDEDSGTET